MASSFEGPFNFVLGVNTYEGESQGDYYVLANTLDLVTSYGNPALAAPPLYPGSFNNTGDPSGENFSDGVAVFGEVYYDITPSLKFTLGFRYNEDNREVRDTSVLFNSVDNAAIAASFGLDPATEAFLIGNGLLDANYAANANVGAGRLWSRTTNILLGPLGGAPEAALARYYGVSQADLDAAALTPAYSAERVAISQQVPIVPGFGEQRDLTGSPDEFSWEEWTGRAGFDWQINDTSMAYAFYSRGYKPGGFNPAIPPDFQDTSAFTFASESIDAIEIGTKNTFLDGGLTLNGALFAYDYGDLQITRIANNSSINDNVDAQIWGLEVDTIWRPEALPRLMVDASYSYLNTAADNASSLDPINRTAGNDDWILLNNIDPGSLTAVNYIAREAQLTETLVQDALDANAAYNVTNGLTAVDVTQISPSGVAVPSYFSRSFLTANGVETSDGLPTDLDGNSLPASPEHTIHLGLQYTWDINAIGGSITPRWDYYWQDETFGREFNTPGDRIDAWDQHNASLIYESFDGHWQVRAWIRNIQDSNNITGDRKSVV